MNEPTALQKAFYTIRKLKQLLNEQKQTLPQPIAIIGLSCRFPEAMNKEAYWRLLSNGKEAISELPEARWELLKGTSQAASRDKNCHYWGSYLTDIDAFDAYFFGISPREAKLMEPEQRGLLEVAYEAIEDAGLPIESLEGSNTGVFAGLDASQFAHLQKLDGDVDALYLATGNATSIAANRISYVFDLHGPSMVIDTACSASLVALHLACLNLQNKLCDLALVGGANINLLPIVNLLLSKAKMLSPDGKCKTFDANASGYAPGEGIGVMVLKPLDKALQNKDRIYAVIEGSGVNQDGRTNGLTAPNGLQQEALIEAVYAKANIDPRLISYVECHGTGTFLGDPIEVQALGEVVSKNRTAENPCWIGSVKTNMGHLEPAAGIAGMIKVALSLQQKKIPPHLNFSTPNPHIPFNKYHFRVPQQIEEWPKYGSLRIAGVSGFGFGGTNAHVVMREISDEENQAISLATDSTCEKEELFTLSAKDTDALKSLIEKWCNYLAGNFSLDLSALCYNLHLRRSHYTSRLAIVVRSTRELYDFLCTLRENLLSSAENIFMSKPSNTPWISNTPFAGTETPIEDLHTLAAHYVNHGDIDWKQYERERNYPYQDMPLYPWQHKHYWPSLQENSTEKTESVPIDFYPLQGKKLMASPLSAFEFAFQFNTQIMPEIADTYHIIHVGYYLDMLAFAVKQISGQVSFTVENLVFLSPLMAPDGITVNVHVALQKLESDAFNVSFYSCVSTEEGWTEHAKSMLFIDSSCDKKIANIPSMTKRCPLEQDAKLFYNRITSMGLPAGNSIRWTQKYWLGKEEILCEFSAPNVSNKGENFVLNVHPGVIDASIQPLFMLLPENFRKPFIASSIEKIQYRSTKNSPVYLLASLKSIDPHEEKIKGDWCLINQDNEIIVECKNITLTQLDSKIDIEKIMHVQVLDLSGLSPEESKHQIVDYLSEQIATIFSMPKEDIDIDRSLQRMGMDSLMALVLMRVIETGFGVAYSVQDILKGPSIIEIADKILSQGKQSEIERPVQVSNVWITYRVKRLHPKIRLFCFPYGGGGGSIYRDWHNALPDEIEVCPIQLPAREERMDEEAIVDIDTLIDRLIQNLKLEFDLPFAFFGHSFGSLIGFALTRYLRNHRMPLPVHLFASAYPDPKIPTKSLNKLLEQLKTIGLTLFNLDSNELAALSDEKLMELAAIFNENGVFEYGNHLITPDIVRLLVPTFIGDMRIVKSYFYRDESPFDLPISVFLGQKDTWISYADHLGWAAHTRKQCRVYDFNSGHLFIKDPQCKKEMLNIIANTLAVAVNIPLA